MFSALDHALTLDEKELAQLRAQLTETAYSNLPVSLLGILINACVLAVSFWGAVEPVMLLGWMTLICGVTGWRYFCARSYRRQYESRSVRQWHRLFFRGLVLSAFLWGITPFLFFLPESPIHQAILLIIIAGLCAGAISSLVSQLRAIQLFLLMTLTPVLIQLLAQNSILHYTVTLLIFIFLIMLLIVARRHYMTLYSSLERGILVQKAQEQLNLSEERFKTIFKEAPAGIFFYDSDLRIIESNQEFAAIIQAPLEHVVGLDMKALTDTRVMPAINAVLDGLDGFYEGAYHTKLSDMDIWIALRTSPVRDVDKNLVGGIGIVADISERMEAQHKIHQQAYYDSLTGIPNRAMLLDRLHQALAAYRRHGSIVALLFLDLDHFKKINDSLGHPVGDALLKEAALRLQSILREEDLVSRLGGDEFVILLTDLGHDPKKAVAKVEIISGKIHGIFDQDFTVKGHVLNTSTSIGVAMADEDNRTAEALLKHADTAMYQAKKEGRGTTSFYQLAMDKWIKHRLQLEQDLRSALDAGELELYYQPVVDLAQKKIIGAEALLRWEHPLHGFVNPEEIVSLAEETGLIVRLGAWVLDSACREFKTWHDSNAQMEPLRKLAINVSTHQFNQEGYVDDVLSTLKRYDIDPARISLELTESIIIDRLEDTVEKMKRLRDHGIGIAIDDFGTGYSSLSYLKKLPFSTLKIDRSFTQDLQEDADDATLIETIIAIAKKFNLYVIAEGVETPEQYAFLCKHDCHAFQGYLCSEPLTGEDFMKLRRTLGDVCRKLEDSQAC